MDDRLNGHASGGGGREVTLLSRKFSGSGVRSVAEVLRKYQFPTICSSEIEEEIG